MVVLQALAAAEEPPTPGTPAAVGSDDRAGAGSDARRVRNDGRRTPVRRPTSPPRAMPAAPVPGMWSPHPSVRRSRRRRGSRWAAWQPNRRSRRLDGRRKNQPSDVTGGWQLEVPRSTYRLQITRTGIWMMPRPWCRTCEPRVRLGLPVPGAGCRARVRAWLRRRRPRRGRRRVVAGEGVWRDCADAAHDAGLGVLVDIVPNHVGVATPALSVWWWDVLAKGRASEHARHSTSTGTWAAGKSGSRCSGTATTSWRRCGSRTANCATTTTGSRSPPGTADGDRGSACPSALRTDELPAGRRAS